MPRLPQGSTGLTGARTWPGVRDRAVHTSSPSVVTVLDIGHRKRRSTARDRHGAPARTGEIKARAGLDPGQYAALRSIARFANMSCSYVNTRHTLGDRPSRPRPVQWPSGRNGSAVPAAARRTACGSTTGHVSKYGPGTGPTAALGDRPPQRRPPAGDLLLHRLLPHRDHA